MREGRMRVEWDFFDLYPEVETLLKTRGFQATLVPMHDIFLELYAKRPGRDLRTGLPDWAALRAAEDDLVDVALVGVVTLAVAKQWDVWTKLGRSTDEWDALISLLGATLGNLRAEREIAGIYNEGLGDGFEILIPDADLQATKERAIALMAALAAVDLPPRLAAAYQGVTATWASREPGESLEQTRDRASRGARRRGRGWRRWGLRRRQRRTLKPETRGRERHGMAIAGRAPRGACLPSRARCVVEARPGRRAVCSSRIRLAL